MTFKVIDDAGTEVEYYMLFTFESEETGKAYIAYTDKIFDDDGNMNVYASIYESELDGIKLIPIKSDKEWEIIELIFEELQKEFLNNEG